MTKRSTWALPYAVFLVLFVALPLLLIMFYAFRDASGGFTFGNFTKFFTDKGYELMIQDYNAFEPESTVGLIIRPADIQVMKKERTHNVFEGEMAGENSVRFLGAEWECNPVAGVAEGDKVKVEVDFSKVDLIDHPEDGTLEGEVYFLLYKGDHYHLTVRSEHREYIWIDTNDIWDKGDRVGINIAPKDIKITKCDD